jgi:hypothetical protein
MNPNSKGRKKQASIKRRRPPSRMVGVRRRAHSTITMNAATNFSEALGYTLRIGMEPKIFLTIQWWHAQAEASPAERTRRLVALLAVWLGRRGVVPIWLYSREVGGAGSEHLHLMIYVPKRHREAFCDAVHRWIALETVGEVRATAVKIKPITFGLHTRLKRYFLKEGTDDVRRWFSVPSGYRYRRKGGLVLGPRVKVSQAIDRGARDKARGPEALAARRRPQGSQVLGVKTLIC